ncbi:M28 family peptidase [Aestuariibaculum sp. YM273]|uniref:M28 family peptidase n=1 Tax=Aestuariibaculum sp. YM273 TaxID=3070659 RepID=UPI0027DD88F2|nr:M28 family peptidase [Aestuariibaculum sp. YM273]WMI66434.1 M28 family peptidase [Aestuariibaculum sp. YM273]
MNKLFCLIVICFLSFSNGSAQAKSEIYEPSFFEETLLKNIENLSADAFEGRRTGTRGGIKARKYVINEFSKLGVQPLFKRNYEQPFTFTLDGKYYEAANVLGVIKGEKYPDKYIVISAHYDHEGIKHGEIYNGADDNASGVGALFSFAEYYQYHQPKYSIILAAFDAEELGLQGSKYFVNNPKIPFKNIVFNINMDMISRSENNELFAVGAAHYPFLKSVIKGIETPDNFKLSMGHDQGNWKEDWTHSSDHAPFHKQGIPFLYFGVEDHSDYHEPTDDYENIQPVFYSNAVKVIISVFEKLDSLSL